MKTDKKIISKFKGYLRLTLLIILLFTMGRVFAEEGKTAEMKLSFKAGDSLKTCTALVVSQGKPVANVVVKFFAKRMFSLLPLGGEVTTGEDGIASIDFPKDLPGDEQKNIMVIAKIEDDEVYGSVETQATVNWGVNIVREDHWKNRSLSASREKAPMLLIVVSNIIIAVIWGVILYIIIQVFRIRKSSTLIKKINKNNLN